MICQIFIVPTLFVAFQYLQERVKPIQWNDPDSSEVDAEFKGYVEE